MSSLSPNTYRVDFDRRGLVRGMFVIPSENSPWSMVDYIETRAKERFGGIMLLKVRRSKYAGSASMSQWTAKWTYDGWEDISRKRRMML